MDDSNPMDPPQPDPLLEPGAYIDPNPYPPSNGNGYGGVTKRKRGSGVVEETVEANRPDWLPPGWIFVEKTRASGASAGSKDKYFKDPVSGRRFRSKKEVMHFLESGSAPSKKQKILDSDGSVQATPVSESSKKKKSKSEAKTSIKSFDYDDVPEMVKWSMTDLYEGTFRPLINGADRVPESTIQEWQAAFTYLSLQTEKF